MKTRHETLRQQAGFTLVELAIVMVIIGLLLAAVLKGSEMINNAKVKSAISQINSYSAGLYSYLDRYGSYPGDDPNATTRLGAAAGGNGNGDGDLDGSTCNVNTDESCLAIAHMRVAGFLAGNPADLTGATIVLPNLSIGGQVRGIYSANVTPAGASAAVSGLWLDVNNVEGEFANQIDQKLDDGQCNTGSMFTTNAAQCSSGLYVATTRVGFLNKM